MRKAKIVCTIGPASSSKETIMQMIEAGMNVARLNFSHGDHAEQQGRINLLKEARAELGVPLGILLDTKGPEIRIGKFRDGQTTLREGMPFTLTTRDIAGDNTCVSVSFADLPKDMHHGKHILLDDGLIELSVDSVDGSDIHCTVINGGVIKDKKGVNLPGTVISIPFLSEKDKQDIAFGCSQGVDYIAASFVQSADNVHALRALLSEYGGTDVRIIAKIESRSGVDNFEEILHAADGIMIARGDLGVEIPIEEVPLAQKRMILLCNNAGKPVITATQMLESMIHNPRPTRAEANDVANSIMDGTDAIMLSGETAAGRYPVEAVRMMDRIARNAQQVNVERKLKIPNTTTAAVSHACCDVAQDLGAKAIITPTKSGTTAWMVARHRPDCPIIACAINEACYHRLSLAWGVIPLMTQEIESPYDLFESCMQRAEACGLLSSGDIAIVTAGVPMSTSGTTNLLHVLIAGDVLLRGEGVGTRSVYGRARLATDPDIKTRFAQGDILIAQKTDNRLLPMMKQAGAIVVEGDDPLGHAAVVGLALDIPVILSGTNALQRIRDGSFITVDAEAGFVYNGDVLSRKGS